MAEKEQAKKKGQDEGGGEGGGDEELLRHPVMAFPPFTPVLVTAQRIPFYAEPDENAKVVGEARMKEVVPVLEAQGPWLMTVCKFEEAWFQAAYVERVEQDAPTVIFSKQEVVHDAYEEYQDNAEPGRKVPTETAAYMDQADGYGMMVMPGSQEEMFAQAYAELVYAFEPNAEMIGTYAHIMNVFSPDTVVELEDFIAIPAQVEAGGKTGSGPLFPEERQQRGGGSGGGGRDRLQPTSPAMATAVHGGGGGGGQPKPLGTLSEVAPQVASMAQSSWGVSSVAGVEVVEDGALADQGHRAAVADAATIRVAPGASGDVELMLEEAAHIVQHENQQAGRANTQAPRDVGALEAEAQRAVEAALTGERFNVIGLASTELHGGDEVDRAQIEAAALEQARALLERAGAERDAVASVLQSVATASGAELVGLEHSLKTEESLARKIADRVRSSDVKKRGVEAAVKVQADKVNDALRFTYKLRFEGYTTTVDTIIEQLGASGLTYLRAYNGWAGAGTDKDTGYRGLNGTFQTSSGLMFELQFHTEDSLGHAKKTHPLYEEQRAKDTSSARRAELQEQQVEAAQQVPVPEGSREWKR